MLFRSFKLFIKDILNDLGKDQLKEIRDYLRKNRVYIWKKARKSIVDGLLRAIYELTPLKWPADDPAPSTRAPPAQAPSAQALSAQTPST